MLVLEPPALSEEPSSCSTLPRYNRALHSIREQWEGTTNDLQGTTDSQISCTHEGREEHKGKTCNNWPKDNNWRGNHWTKHREYRWRQKLQWRKCKERWKCAAPSLPVSAFRLQAVANSPSWSEHTTSCWIQAALNFQKSRIQSCRTLCRHRPSEAVGWFKERLYVTSWYKSTIPKLISSSTTWLSMTP